MRIDRKTATVIMIVLLVVAFAVLYYGYQQLSGRYSPEGGGSAVYEEAPDFTLENLDGEEVTLSDYRGTAVVLNFWASWCPPCREEMPHFDALSDEYEESGEVVFLMVNLTDGAQETAGTAKHYLDAHGYTLDVLLDSEGDASIKYDVASIPATYMIDKDGFIRNVFVGSISEATLSMEVTKLLTMQDE